ncbi:MAG TPA: hypothetical protein PKD49_07205 [Hyphomicrobium sp.]|nr:hypothetical protein [Hyphomicrobium sp.]
MDAQIFDDIVMQWVSERAQTIQGRRRRVNQSDATKNLWHRKSIDFENKCKLSYFEDPLLGSLIVGGPGSF